MMDAAAQKEREQRWRRRMLLWLLLLLLVLVGSVLPRALARGEPLSAPTITRAPPGTTSSSTAVSSFSGTFPFECALDGAVFASCSSPVRYEGLAAGRHVFLVRSRSGDGVAPTTAHHWQILLVPAPPGAPPSPTPPSAGSAPAPTPTTPEVIVPVDGPTGQFGISGDVRGPLSPGVARALPLVVSNPNSFPIEVTELIVTVAPGNSRPSCDGPTNLAVMQAGVEGAVSLVVPAAGRVRLPAQGVGAPIVRMRNLPTNQDACKSARFTLRYDGAAAEAQP